MVQLWETQADMHSDTLAMKLALWHEGGVTFDCKWCPDPCLRDAGTATHETALPRCTAAAVRHWLKVAVALVLESKLTASP